MARSAGSIAWTRKPLAVSHHTDLAIRKATIGDANVLAALDAEHWQHYTRSPSFMTPRASTTADQFAGFLTRPKKMATR